MRAVQYEETHSALKSSLQTTKDSNWKFDRQHFSSVPSKTNAKKCVRRENDDDDDDDDDGGGILFSNHHRRDHQRGEEDDDVVANALRRWWCFLSSSKRDDDDDDESSLSFWIGTSFDAARKGACERWWTTRTMRVRTVSRVVVVVV